MVWASMRGQSRFWKLCRGKILRQGNSVYTGIPPLEDHNTKPVLISCAFIKVVQSWGIWKELQLYTSISLYRAFPSTQLSKVGLPLPVSLFLWNRGGLVNEYNRSWKCTFTQKQACCAGCRRRPFTAEAPPMGKIHPFSKIAVHFEPVIQFGCLWRSRISLKIVT